MIDREKVIKGLECCQLDVNKCLDCPYLDKRNKVAECGIELHRDALALLKAQEPRLLEINELTSWDGIMYIECKGIYPIAAELDSYRSMYSFSVLRYDEPWEQLSSQYGKTWRCWTSRPTDEQRETVKWE